VLEAGTYVVADTQERVVPSGAHLTNATKRGVASFEVEGDGDGELPETPATIVAREHGYETDGIVAGANRVTFRNAGREFHQAVAFPIADDVAFGAGRRTVLEREAETGWVPIDVPHQRATTVVEGGREQVVEMTFDPGRYLLLCFVTPRDGGLPQWKLGMSSKLVVSRR
jgi:hypothetical protein